MIQEGCKMKRFADSYDSAWKIIEEQLSDPQPQRKVKPDKRETSLDPGGVQLSTEMVDDHKGLQETLAAKKLTDELNKLIKQQTEMARRLEQSSKGRANPLLVTQMDEQRRDIERKIDEVAAQLKQLKIPFTRRLVSFFRFRKTQKSMRYVQVICVDILFANILLVALVLLNDTSLKGWFMIELVVTLT